MKSRRLLAVCVFLAASVLAAQSEGIATYKIVTRSGDQSPQGTSKISFSRSAVRMDMQMDLAATGAPRGEQGGPRQTYETTIIQKQSEPDRVYVVSDRQKTYSVMDVSGDKQNARSDETWTFKRLGRASVAGVTCQNATLTSSKGAQVETCIATELVASSSWWSAMNGRGGSDGWIRSMNGAGLRGFPVRVKYRSGRGNDGVEMDLVTLQRRSVPSAVFEIPADYKQTSPGMAAMTPEHRKMMEDALSRMTPEQRKAYEDAIKKAQQNPH